MASRELGCNWYLRHINIFFSVEKMSLASIKIELGSGESCPFSDQQTKHYSSMHCSLLIWFSSWMTVRWYKLTT
jgi:hypothetical protein